MHGEVLSYGGVTFPESPHDLGFVDVFSTHMMKLPPLSKVPPPTQKNIQEEMDRHKRIIQKIENELLVWPEGFRNMDWGYSVGPKVLQKDGLLEQLLDPW
jgi:hypothetical protein